MNIRVALILVLAAVFFIPHTALAETKPQEPMPFAVYTDKNSRGNHFIPSGWMGDYGAIRVDLGSIDNPHSGSSCIKIIYTAEPTQGAGWGGIYWQNPANNWGLKDGGFNLSNAKKLTFWACGEKGGEKLEFKIGGMTGAYPDTDIAEIGPVNLTAEWRQYTIDLSSSDISYISGGFVWAANNMDNPDGFTIYLDDIIYE